MRKVFIFVMLCIISIFATETAIFFAYNCDKLDYQKRILMKSNHELTEENKNLRVILDSIDNPHHHDYLMSAYRNLQK